MSNQTNKTWVIKKHLGKIISIGDCFADDDENFYPWLEVSEADAQLLSAAPVLLDALQCMVDYYGSASANVDALFKARAAIAKATGGAV